MRKILFNYLFRELVAPIVLGLLVFTFIVISVQMLRSISAHAGFLVPFPLMIKIFLCYLPHFFLLTLPMACFLGVMLAYGRLSEQHEIVAMQAAGVSYWRILMPALVFGFGLSLGLFVWMETVIPRTRLLAERIQKDLVDSITALIQEGTFRNFESFIFYTRQYYPEQTELRGIQVYQMQENQIERLILAPYGKVHFDPDSRMLQLNLQSGAIYQRGAKGGFFLAEFADLFLEFDVDSSVRKILRLTEKYPGENREEMLERMKAYQPLPRLGSSDWKAWIELNLQYHRRLALPLACGLVSLVAMPLGLMMGKGRRAILFSAGLILTMAYYFLLVGGENLAILGQVSPFIGGWLPNGVLLLAGLVLNGLVIRHH